MGYSLQVSTKEKEYYSRFQIVLGLKSNHSILKVLNKTPNIHNIKMINTKINYEFVK
jgi:hypothetical protein